MLNPTKSVYDIIGIVTTISTSFDLRQATSDIVLGTST